MKKNTANQVISFQMISTTTGAPVTTGTPVIWVCGDGGTSAEQAGSTAVHEGTGTGCWSYVPTQGETNYSHISFTMLLTGAVAQTVNVYPTFPQTGDSFALIGIPAGASLSVDIFAIDNLVDDLETRITEARLSELDAGTAGKMANQVNEIRTDTEDIQSKIGTPLDLGNGVATLAGNLSDVDDEVDTIHAVTLDLAVTGAPLNTVANGRTLNSSTAETSGTYASTEFSNGVYHVLTAAGATPNGIIDIEYLVTLPNSMAVPTSVEIEGYLKESPAAGGDSVNLQIYNYVTPGWDVIMPILFTGIVTDGPSTATNHNLLARHVGTVGGDIGKMRIRLYSNSLETGTTLNIDKLNVGYAEAVSSSITAIKNKTDNLPTDPADQSAVEATIAALNDISVADIIAGITDGSYDLQEMLRIMFAVLAGRSSGGGTETLVFKDPTNTTTRITATVNASGDRTAITPNGA